LTNTKLLGADLSGADLTGADLSNAPLSGANLSNALLSGAILSFKYIFLGDYSVLQIDYYNSVLPLSQLQAKREADNLHNALLGLAKFQGETGRADLLQKTTNFRRKISKQAELDINDAQNCLANEEVLENLNFCNNINDPQARNSAYEIWLQLACEDITEQHWVAHRMIERTKYIYPLGFTDFAPLLADKLQKPGDCPGLKNLDDEWKKRLLDAAKQQNVK